MIYWRGSSPNQIIYGWFVLYQPATCLAVACNISKKVSLASFVKMPYQLDDSRTYVPTCNRSIIVQSTRIDSIYGENKLKQVIPQTCI